MICLVAARSGPRALFTVLAGPAPLKSKNLEREASFGFLGLHVCLWAYRLLGQKAIAGADDPMADCRRGSYRYLPISPLSEWRVMRAKLPRTGLHRPITTYFGATLWMGSGGSPMTGYRTVCIRMQDKLQMVRQGLLTNRPHPIQ
jgi:hypothetical protein